jgi:hypothetical protein
MNAYLVKTTVTWETNEVVYAETEKDAIEEALSRSTINWIKKIEEFQAEECKPGS